MIDLSKFKVITLLVFSIMLFTHCNRYENYRGLVPNVKLEIDPLKGDFITGKIRLERVEEEFFVYNFEGDTGTLFPKVSINGENLRIDENSMMVGFKIKKEKVFENDSNLNVIVDLPTPYDNVLSISLEKKYSDTIGVKPSWKPVFESDRWFD